MGNQVFAAEEEVGLLFAKRVEANVRGAPIPPLRLIGAADLGNDHGHLLGGVADDLRIATADYHILCAGANLGRDHVAGNLIPRCEIATILVAGFFVIRACSGWACMPYFMIGVFVRHDALTAARWS